MTELAYNIVWSWEPIVRALFRRLDPGLWRECGYNPVLMLGRVSQATLRTGGPGSALPGPVPRRPASASTPAYQKDGPHRRTAS